MAGPPPGPIGATGERVDPSKPDWRALAPRPTTRWHRTATTMGPGPKVGITAALVALLVAEALLLPWGPLTPLGLFIMAVSVALVAIVLAGVWRKGIADVGSGPAGGPDVTPGS